jgi:hypothetical protein
MSSGTAHFALECDEINYACMHMRVDGMLVEYAHDDVASLGSHTNTCLYFSSVLVQQLLVHRDCSHAAVYARIGLHVPLLQLLLLGAECLNALPHATALLASSALPPPVYKRGLTCEHLCTLCFLSVFLGGWIVLQHVLVAC